MIWALVLVAVVLALPFLREALRPRMTDADRQSAPGQFARLSQGVTHYRWQGPEGGPVAVCVHGLTTPSFVWRGVAEELAAKGVRVLSYDLYGRGYSDRPKGAQDSAFFLRQLQDLLADQQVGDGFTLIGYSMGGSISAAFAAAHPGRLKRLILLAPAGMQPLSGAVARVVLGVPFFGDWLMLTMFPRRHRKGTDAERGLPTSVPGIVDLQQGELHWRGFVPAVLSSLRHMLSTVLEGEHRAIAAAGLPVLAIWGAEDRTIPIRDKAVLEDWNPDAHHVVIDGAGHGVTYTHAGEVLAAIRS
ncbi:Lipase 3 precursor [Thalassovita gelatinovora]|uniref:Lipase 3 n=1 Tax=Thalassovita gelatinovora TaxID=53501 RepID=A0A0P1FY55_THAGE|nr:alpha/beta hydrolase [Thalassovita gelatinovora]QIZ80691.1 alpha/beta hydrolase [Thalassovita gelatinovora]CUH65271.1 Lipase 3 precursor [Thalassovita gelatinovora]SEQ88596.1 Lysophospholipase, alpha-beta hydrolase superfamily [Thalassovita gelatinovora]